MGFVQTTPIVGNIDFLSLLNQLDNSKGQNQSSNHENTENLKITRNKILFNRLALVNLEFDTINKIFSQYSPWQKEICAHISFRADFKKANPESDDEEIDEKFENSSNKLFLKLIINIKQLSYFKIFIEKSLSLLQEIFEAKIFSSNNSENSKHKNTRKLSFSNFNSLETLKQIKTFDKIRFLVELVKFFHNIRKFDLQKLSQTNLNLDLSYYRRLVRLITIENDFNTNLDNLTIFYSPFKPYFNFVWTILRNVNLENSEISLSLRKISYDIFDGINSKFFEIGESFKKVKKNSKEENKEEKEKEKKEKKEFLMKENVFIEIRTLVLSLVMVICLMDHIEIEGIFHSKSKFEVKEIFKSIKKNWKDSYDNIVKPEELFVEIERNTMHLEDETTKSNIRKFFVK